MNDKLFEKLVNEGIESIPDEFLQKLENVAITIEGDPNEYQREKLRLKPWHSLYGLYEGIAQNRRGSNYTSVLPDKITIFKNPILRNARNQEDVKARVRDTVWHEIAHHFGMSEREARASEQRRRQRLSKQK